MKLATAQEVVRQIEAFKALDHANTDEAGWISVKYSCSGMKARQMIADARATIAAGKATKAEPVGDPLRVESFEIVNVTTGERFLPPYMRRRTTFADGEEFDAYRVEALKANGTPSDNAAYNLRLRVKMPSARWVNQHEWVPYNAAREATANDIRNHISSLYDQLKTEEQRLMDAYLSESQKATLARIKREPDGA